LFSDVFSSLPTGVGSLVSDKLISYGTAPVKNLVDESFASIEGTFGTIKKSSFSKLNVSAPTFETLGIASAYGYSYDGIGGALNTKLPQSVLDIANSIPKEYQSLEFPSAAGIFGGGLFGDVTASDINASGASANSDDTNHLVKLVSSLDSNEFVILKVMPDISEQRNVEFESVHASQMPTEFQKYKGTKSTTWQITATFVSRTTTEATEHYQYLTLLRSWTLPHFGANQENNTRGAPPPILYFSGYRDLVGKVPTVLTGVNWSFPHECDWIPTTNVDSNGKQVPFPVVMTVQINLTESYSPVQVNSFDLAEFKMGYTDRAFSGVVPESSEAAEPSFDINSAFSGINSGIKIPPEIVSISEKVNNAKSVLNNSVKVLDKGISDLKQTAESLFDELGNKIW